MFVPIPPAIVGPDGLSVPSAADTCLVIFLYGSEDESDPDICKPAISPEGNVPPVVGALSDVIINRKRVLVYAPSTKVLHGWTAGQPREAYKFYRRDLELTALLERAQEAGYRRERIVVVGHSAGGWIALTHLARNPGHFAGVVAFAPAFAGQRSGQAVNSAIWVPERATQVRILREASSLPSLVYSFEGDEFESQPALREVFKKIPEVTFRPMGQMRAKQTESGGFWNHNGAYHANFIDQKRRILDFIEQVI